MKVLWFILRILLMLAFVALMGAPLLAEYLSFRKDRKDQITYKRFRIFVYSLIFFILATVAMVLLKDLLLWIESWSVIQWLAGKIAATDRVTYALTVFAVMLINVAIGAVFCLIGRLVRIGLKKRNIVTPAGKDGDFTLGQKIERAVLRFFFHEKWFFAARLLLFMCLTLSAMYSVLFILHQIPIFFGADWLPYKFMESLFNVLYYYPILTLLPLFESFFFLEGVRLLEEECAEFLQEEAKVTENPFDAEKVHEECKKIFKDFYCTEFKGPGNSVDLDSTDYHPLTLEVAKGVEGSQRNPRVLKTGYLNGLDKIIHNDIDEAMGTVDEKGDLIKTKGILINGGFFTGFSVYFLRYVTAILARGDAVVFVCNSREQVKTTHEYIKTAFSELYSLYYKGAGVHVDFDDPLWKICAISGDDKSTLNRNRLDDCSVLVTDLKFLSSAEFNMRQSRFAQLIDTVVFVDVLESVNRSDEQIVMFDTALRNQRDLNELRAKNSSERRDKRDDAVAEARREFRVRYTSKQVKYVCFNDSRTPGLDKVLMNLLAVEFSTADAMNYTDNAILSFYNYEARLNEEGERECPQRADTEEQLGALVNMANFARYFGTSRVSLFAEQDVPYADIAESVSSNENHGLLVKVGQSLLINTPFYNPDDYQVVVAFDTTDNLPETVRRYASMVGDKPSVLCLFSRPYMLRDYYMDNVEDLWQRTQIMQVPVEQTVKRSAIYKILVCAATGGITKREIYAILDHYNVDEFTEMVEQDDLVGILRAILVQCGKTGHAMLQDYFEIDNVRDFDRNGEFTPEERISLRRTGSLYELIESEALTQVKLEGDTQFINLPRNRITQNYIKDQNMLYNGMIYQIRKVDTDRGRIELQHATGGRNNVPYQYLQDREYHVDCNDEVAETISVTKHVEKSAADEFGVREVMVSVKRRPMEVITNGYIPLDHATLAKNGVSEYSYVDLRHKDNWETYRQTYRRYGQVANPVCSSEMIFEGQEQMVSQNRGAQIMSIKLSGEFGENADRITLLAATMVGEILHSMYPSVADSVAVCPVITTKFEDEETTDLLKKLYKVTCHNYTPDAKNIELLIIEDCADDLGVISGLLSSGGNVANILFEPVFQYLDWYAKAETKSEYLYYGLDHEPTCFDFESLHKLAKILGDKGVKLNLIPAEEVVQYDACDFCGKRYPKGDDVIRLEDGRLMCKTCAENLVGNDKKALKSHLDRAKMYLESTYGISLGDDYEFCFESTVKIANALKNNRDLKRRGADLPLQSYVDAKNKVHVEYSLPSANLSELLVRELTHVWQLKHLPNLEEELAEGHLALVGVQYLRFLGHHTLAATRTTYFESTAAASGVGYRRLVSALLKNPQYRNNPFLYLLHQDDGGTSPHTVIQPTKPVVSPGDYGQPYTPEQPDRVPEAEVPYTLRSFLSPADQELYDAIWDAVRNFTPEMKFPGHSRAQLKQVATAVRDDHPELFWFGYFQVADGYVDFDIGCTAEEAAELQRRIDEVAVTYLEGIDDSMSAYDVTLRLHLKMIGEVDYDSVALNRESETGGPKRGKVDRLRTMVGVFLDKKAVCAGYAYAMQYLLRKCGVECTQASGMIRKADGSAAGGHGWNFVKLDGDYYYVDTTWDDSSNTIQSVKNTDPSLDYFAITTNELLRTRDLTWTPVELPECTATRCNYYYHNGLVLESYDMDKIKAWATAAADSATKTMTFKCISKAVYDTAFGRLCSGGEDLMTVLKAATKANRKIHACRYNYDPNIWTITIFFAEE